MVTNKKITISSHMINVKMTNAAKYLGYVIYNEKYKKSIYYLFMINILTIAFV